MSALIDHGPYLHMLAERMAAASSEVRRCSLAEPSAAASALLVLAAAELEESRSCFTTVALSAIKHQREHARSDARLAQHKLQECRRQNEMMRMKFLEELDVIRGQAKSEAKLLTDRLDGAFTSINTLVERNEANMAHAHAEAEAVQVKHAFCLELLDEQQKAERAAAQASAKATVASMSADAVANHCIYAKELESSDGWIAMLLAANVKLLDEKTKVEQEMQQLVVDKDKVINGLCEEIQRLKGVMQVAMTPSAGLTKGPASAWRKMNLEALRKVSRPLLAAEASLLATSPRVAPSARLTAEKWLRAGASARAAASARLGADG